MRRRTTRDYIAPFWLAMTLGITLVHRWVPEATWLMIHLVLLGALTHSAVVWSEHFASTLLHRPVDDAQRKARNRRTTVLAAGAGFVFVGIPLDWWWLVLTGALIAASAVAWHCSYLYRELSAALPSRFRVVIHYYIAAAIMLHVGMAFGVALAFGLNDSWHFRLLAAHLVFNLLGWIGLTVIGTLTTFWPTVLRTRMDERAERLTTASLPVFILGIVTAAAGAVIDLRAVTVAGLLIYLGALTWWGRNLIQPLRAKGLTQFPSASIAAALAWGGASFAYAIYLIVRGWEVFNDSVVRLAAMAAGGFGLQLLIGALSYLIPSVAGGSPAGVRRGTRLAQMGQMAADYG